MDYVEVKKRVWGRPEVARRGVNFKPSNLDVCEKGEGDMLEEYCWKGD